MLLRTLVILILLTTATAAQQGSNGVVTFTSGTQLVLETLSVTDKGGHTLEGLTAKDFTITENGTPQEIRFFEYQRLAEHPPTGEIRAGLEDVHVYEKLGRTQISPEPAGDTRYKDRRLLALYFDLTATPPQDQLRAIRAAQTFIRNEMTSTDLVAILRYSGASVDVLEDFTNDRSRLLSILETLAVGEGQGFGEITSDLSRPDTGMAFGQDDSEFNIFNSDRQLSALQTAAEMLGQLREKKLLIYFASGLRLNALDNQAQLQATIHAAVRANVSFWPIDARGLVAQPPLGSATEASPGNAGMYTGAGVLANTATFQQSQDTLYALAGDTGGKALLDYNDLGKGIIEAQHSISSYYVIGYYTTNTTQDGKFRRIKITLNDEASAHLDYREGYFAGKEFKKFTGADKERQLEEALMMPNPMTELTIAMEIDYFQLNRAEYFVPVIVKLPGRELALAKRGGAEKTLIDFIGEVKDEFGNTVTNVRDKVDIKLGQETAAELLKRPIEYDTGFTLLPGKYSIKFLARDAETGRIGTFQSAFFIPNLNKETRCIPISSVVLSSQWVDFNNALFNAMKGKHEENQAAANPLVQNGRKLIPSVTRVFNKNRDLHVYLQAYEPDVADVQPLITFVTFYEGEKKAYESGPIQINESLNDRLRTVPLEIEVPLKQLVAGKYECQVTVLNPNKKLLAFWRTPIAVVQ